MHMHMHMHMYVSSCIFFGLSVIRTKYISPVLSITNLCRKIWLTIFIGVSPLNYIFFFMHKTQIQYFCLKDLSPILLKLM